jgi:hypothetical protein
MMFQKIIDRTRACIDYTTRYQTIVIPNLGVMNRNSRIYTKETAKTMSGGPFNNMFGQIGHPENDAINLENASHVIYGTFLVGNDLWAEYSIMDSSHGRLLYDLLQNGDFVLRPRGYGTIRPDGTVSTDYKLISFDFIPVEEDAFTTLENG